MGEKNRSGACNVLPLEAHLVPTDGSLHIPLRAFGDKGALMHQLPCVHVSVGGCSCTQIFIDTRTPVRELV